MAVFRHDEADRYGTTSNSFFSLKNDMDTAVVRFMYNTMDDVEGMAVHQIQLGDKKRYVNCIRNYDDPLDACPLCAAGFKQQAKVFVAVYDTDAKEVKIWDRGKNFFTTLSSLCARYNPLVSTPIEIERNGKAGDTSTRYATYPGVTDEITLEDLPDLPTILGGLVLDKSFEDLETFVETGNLPMEQGEAGKPERNPAADRPQRRAAAPSQPATRRPTARKGNKAPF